MIDLDRFILPDPAEFFMVPVGMNASKMLTQTVGGVLGGERDSYFQVIGASAVNSANGLLGNDSGEHAFQFATLGMAPAVATLTYDGIEHAGLGGIDLTSGGSNNRFELQFLTSDAQPSTGLDIVVTVTSPGGTLAATVTAPNSQSAFVVQVSFSLFTGSGSLNQADKIDVAFNTINKTPNIDFELNGITIVPEPGCGILLSLGVALAGLQFAGRQKLRPR
ncbi:MAG: hypothetical protein IT427_00345 [Pirellulales bacterium]|nr:hypothetical protein [Pirellulales bacterium]